MTKTTIGGADILGPIDAGFEEILTEEAMAFVAELARAVTPDVKATLQARVDRQKKFDAGELPDFLPETAHIREGDWQVRGIPADLLDRRVEITGPVDRKMVINALNTPVKCYMADFEDSHSPTWDGQVNGQINLRDAINRTIEYTNPKNGKEYKLVDDNPVLIARARGLHLYEKHVEVDGEQVPGAVFDFALYFFHNHKQLIANGSGPYFYIPKLQSHQEARIWARMMDMAEDKFGLARGTVKGTILIETLPAVFEMDEILYEMRDHIVALNCGRWDYIFSYIKTLRRHADRVLPDRGSVTMDKPFLDSYSRLLIQTCHKRGAMAMGGMAALIPSKDPVANQAILDKVVDDKTREAKNGHDGTWIAHPGLASTALGVMDEYFGDQPNLMNVSREGETFAAADLLAPCTGERTEDGMRHNIKVAVQYIEAWISGNGCVPIYGLMEDAATAEISRASIWQWIQHGCDLSNGKKVTKDFFRQLLAEEMEVVKEEIGAERYDSGKFADAGKIMEEITTSNDFVDFLTLPAYDYLD